MLDVKFDLVKKSLSLSKLHWTLWLPGWHDCICDNPKVENLGSKKFFWKTSFDVLMEWSRIITHGVRQLFLVINHVRFWKKQNALLLCQSWIFFKNSVYHICNAFLRNLSTHTKKMNYQLNVVLKKQSSCWRWKEQNHFRLSQSYLRRLSGSTLHAKNEEISKFLYFVSFGKKFEMKLVETVFLSIRFKFKQTSYSWKTN